MFTIDQMIKDVLIREGGFVDAMGEGDESRKFGISHTMLSEYYGRAAFKYEVETLSEEIAHDIYERNYYITPRINNLPRLIPFPINFHSIFAQRLEHKLCIKSGVSTKAFHAWVQISSISS